MPPRPSPTHFLCIPLVTGASRPQLAASLGSFRADVSAPPEAGGFGIPETAVRPVGTIHLTLGVMSFPPGSGGGGGSSSGNGATGPGLEAAVSLLKTLVPRQILASIRSGEARGADSTTAAVAATPATAKASPSTAGEESQTAASAGTIRPPPLLSVTLRGLHSMQPASRATVLYAAPADDNGQGTTTTLQAFCEKLRAAFQEAGLMVSEEERDARPLLLHATVLNTIYVKGGGKGKGGKGGGGRRREKLTVDARPILDRYDDFVWMRDVPLEKIAICRMGAKKVGDDGDEAYEVEAEIDLA